MFVLHTGNVDDGSGHLVPTILGWDHFNGADILQSATANLALQPFLDNMNSRNPSSTKAFNYFMSGNDAMDGSNARDVMKGLGGNDTMDGFGGKDRIWGGDGNDFLHGGAGADKIVGGAGADTFDFSSMADAGDHIADFAHGVDAIALDHVAFAFGEPLIDGETFVAGPGEQAATTASPTLLYNVSTGVLSYDADGSGTGAPLVLATLTNHSTLTVDDIVLT